MSSQGSNTPTRWPIPSYVGKARSAVLLLATLALLAACGPRSGGINVTLDDANIEVLRGASGTVEVTLVRSGAATGAVELTLAPLPGDVTATFSPAVLSGNTLKSTLTVAIAAEAAEGVHDRVVSANSGDQTVTEALGLEIVSLAVNGRVLDEMGHPRVGVGVTSQGQDTVSDETGGFQLSGLSVPYDLAIWNTVQEDLTIIEGLTSSEPVLTVDVGSLTPLSRTTTLNGNLSEAVVSNELVSACVEGVEVFVSGCQTLEVGESVITIPATWRGTATTTVTLHILRTLNDPASRLPVSYTGYHETVELTLQDTVPFNFPSALPTGEAPPSTTVDLSIESDVPLVGTIAAVRLGPDFMLPVAASGTTTEFEMVMPDIAGADYTFVSLADMFILTYLRGGWTTGVTGDTATVVMPEQLNYLSPEDGATGVDLATVFSTDHPSGDTRIWYWSESGGDFEVSLITTRRDVQIPDPGDYGFSLPAGVNFSWQQAVSAGAAPDSGDSVTNAIAIIWDLILWKASRALEHDGSYVYELPWSFTTAP